jgi:HSP20 family protein
MKALTRWDPFKEMEEWQDQLGSLFRQPLGRRENGGREAMAMANWAPLVDITEDEHEFLIKAELPEVRKEDMQGCEADLGGSEGRLRG